MAKCKRIVLSIEEKLEIVKLLNESVSYTVKQGEDPQLQKGYGGHGHEKES